MDQGLLRDPLFVALTRPQMFAGVTYSFFVINLIVSTEFFLIFKSVWAVAVALLIVGIVALADGQPWGVWYGLLLPGAIGTLVVGANSVVILKRYREVEERRLAAKDLL